MQNTNINAPSKMPKFRSKARLALHVVTIAGNFMTAVGFILLLLGVTNLFDMDVLSFGLSSGIRIVGSIVISGCLFSAIGYGISEHLTK